MTNPTLSLVIRVVAIGDPLACAIYLKTVPMRVDTDDCVDHVCQRGLRPQGSFQVAGQNVGTGLGGVPRGISVTGHALADTLLIRPTWWARPVLATLGTG